ncbi:hypothetical protein [Heyndrickxia faecalis]|uniref:hypothetical protein n=1 Tax=Heyndrickxia faecalis TaxID=2824910 RepID=UPI0007796F41|nr:hypothetical protein B4100_0955 [Heyndrickxia coagulans]
MQQPKAENVILNLTKNGCGNTLGPGKKLVLNLDGSLQSAYHKIDKYQVLTFLTNPSSCPKMAVRRVNFMQTKAVVFIDAV